MSGKTGKRYFQEPLFDELRKDYCYVCFERIRSGEGINVGKNTWRHKKCRPGSHRWAKSSIIHSADDRGYFSGTASTK